MAVPSKFARAMLLPLVEVIPADAVIVNVAKGIEETSLKTMSEMLADIAPRVNKVAVLSGPGFAAELAAGRPAAMVAAAASDAIARGVQALFSTRTLRIYRSRDVVGVELAGTVKNVIAIAAGISDGLDLGSSARAGLITRGIAELMRLVRAAGGSAETVAGLAGVGDLVLTCTGVLSRNRSVGLSLARGERPSGSTNGRPVAEGITNARAVYQLAERLGVEMPIVTAVYRVLYEDASASGMVDELLSRELKAEFGH
jgi:glycerol-3-phosphate dehydrogenase (NAD(P)+)